MEFIRHLEEARLTRNASNVKALSYTDCCERTFLTVLILEIMRKYPSQKNFVSAYSNKTLEKSDYSQYRAFSTDLYNFVHFITGDSETLKKLKQPKAALAMRDKTSFPVLAFNRYLRSLATNAQPSSVPSFLIQIENSLNITNSNYKAIRRNVANYANLSPQIRKATVTKLLLAARAKLRSSDIIDDFSELAADRDLEIDKVKDTEPKISVRDPVTTSGELALYRLLVGTNNLMRTKKFIDLARNKKGIPPQFTQGYMPIVDMVDDIVKAGPMYVQLLKQIHKRAKNTPK